MRKIFLVVLVCLMSFNCSAWAQPTNKYLLGTLEVLADSALEGYNTQDSVQFYKYFAKSMEELTKDQYFKSLYVEVHMRDLGYLESKVLLLDQSSLDPNFPNLVYKAKFQKRDNIWVTVNFQKEYENYRITRIKYNKDYSLQEKWKDF